MRDKSPHSISLASPDGHISVIFELKTNRQPYSTGEGAYYRVAYTGKLLLANSPLGLKSKGAPPIDRNLEIINTERRFHDETWENSFGVKRHVRDHYNQLTVSLRERFFPGRLLGLIFRTFNLSMS